MSEYPGIVNQDRAARLIKDVRDPRSREAIELLVRGIEQFFEEQPSQLRSSFDLAFFVEILKDRIDLVRSSLNGSQEAEGWWEDENFPSPRPVLNPDDDVSDTGIRQRQAYNYEASRGSKGLQATLLALMNAADIVQRPNVKESVRGEWKPIVSIRPEHPFDYLFMVMAVDYALRPGQQLRILLERGTYPSRRS
jgi:hypothetical protein